MPTLAELKAALSDPAYYRQVGGGLLDAYNRGAVGGLLGAPVDMANGVLNAGKMAAGYAGNKLGLLSGDQMPQPDMMPVGGSEWIGQKMQDAGMVSPNRNVPAEMLAGLAGIPLTAMAAAKAGPMVEKGIGQAMANAQMPSTLNLPQYSGQRGAIAYHGSPHKFDKFKTEAIGTGEGAQAYGHGLYLSESPAVADEYAGKLSTPFIEFATGKTSLDLSKMSPEAQAVAKRMHEVANTTQYQSRSEMAGRVLWGAPDHVQKELIGNAPRWKAFSTPDSGSFYKTDIPDEAVAKMLDWDKPLSQQSPETVAALRNGYKQSFGVSDRYLDDLLQPHKSIGEAIGGGQMSKIMTENLQRQGIPGIRYLDGGSRSTGAGTSNYVAFDPEMIRILERNGQPTGLLPWQPGEWGNK